jgi:Tfp pilus assembly protein PilN
MVRAVLGLGVSATMVHAVLVERGAIAWAGQAAYQTEDDLAEVIAHLAEEAGRPVRRARIALERDAVQLRTVTPVPLLKPGPLRRYVALEATRLFRKNGAPLVTDGISVAGDASTRALWMAAAPEPLLRRILDGANQAGLRVETLGPAADVLPGALAVRPSGEASFPNGQSAEVLSVGLEGTWRSRLVRTTPNVALEWATALAALGADAASFAAAYAVTVRWPRLELWPPETRAGHAREQRRRLLRLALIGLVCWFLAGGVYVGRLLVLLRSSNAYLVSVSAQVDSALAARRELDAGRATLASMAGAERDRSRHLALLADLTWALGDSAYLTTCQVDADGAVRISGYAASAPTVLATLERLGGLARPKFEGPVARETTNEHRQLDRFAIVAQLERAP